MQNGQPTPLAPLECAANQVGVGMSARTSGDFGAPTEIQFRCATITASGQVQLQNFTGTLGSIIDQTIGDSTIECPTQHVATGIRGRSGGIIDSLRLQCNLMTVAP